MRIVLSFSLEQELKRNFIQKCLDNDEELEDVLSDLMEGYIDTESEETPEDETEGKVEKPKWPGYRVNGSTEEINGFQIKSIIFGGSLIEISNGKENIFNIHISANQKWFAENNPRVNDYIIINKEDICISVDQQPFERTYTLIQ